MLRETFARIRILSFELPDPPRADKAMHKLICSNIETFVRIRILSPDYRHNYVSLIGQNSSYFIKFLCLSSINIIKLTNFVICQLFNK